jgi:hypothetical protein
MWWLATDTYEAFSADEPQQEEPRIRIATWYARICRGNGREHRGQVLAEAPHVDDVVRLLGDRGDSSLAIEKTLDC